MLATMERKAAIAVDQESLERVRLRYEDGDYLGAHEAALAIGPLDQWRGTAPRVLAGRLASQLGGVRLGHALHLRAWRSDPADPEACYYRARALLARRGPLPTWQFLRSTGPLEAASDEIRADWLASHALALGGLRDFDAAEEYLAEAERLAPGRAWLRVERANVFEMQDLYNSALAAARGPVAPTVVPPGRAGGGALPATA